MDRRVLKLIGAGIGIAVALGWPIYRSWRTESTSPCAQIIGRADVERLTGKQIDKFAGHDRDYGCTAAYFAVRGPLETTTELVRVEMNRISRHFDEISKDGLWQRDVVHKEPLSGVGDRALLMDKSDGSTAIFAESGGVTIELYFRREFGKDKAIEIARGAPLSTLVSSVGRR